MDKIAILSIILGLCLNGIAFLVGWLKGKESVLQERVQFSFRLENFIDEAVKAETPSPQPVQETYEHARSRI